MRTIYNIIGAYFYGFDSIALIRFDFFNGVYQVLDSEVIHEIPTYTQIWEAIDRLASVPNLYPSHAAPTIDVLSNFSASLTGQMQNLSNYHNMRFKTTQPDATSNDSILCLISLIKKSRLISTDKIHAASTLMRLNTIDRRQLKQFQDGNDRISPMVFCILHSIVYLEGRLARFKMHQ